MKATKKIVGATAALVAALALSAGSTFAWFSSNSSVTATGMDISVATTKNIVISKDEGFTAANVTVAFTEVGEKTLSPSTHIAEGENYTTYTSGLKYVTNPEVIDPVTGLVLGGQTANYADAVKTGALEYYIDYVVYIASPAEAFNITSLNAELECEGATQTQKAVSVDFYACTNSGGTFADPSADTFKGTLNLAQKDNSSNEGTKTSLAITDIATMPTTEAKGIEVTMRVYIDGALVDNDSNAYVNSTVINLNNIQFSVKFTAMPAAD